MVAAIHAAAPIEVRIAFMVHSAIQPRFVPGALRQIYARLLDEIRLIWCVNHGEVAVKQVVAHAAALKIAMVGRQGLKGLVVGRAFPRNAFRFIVHAVVIARTDRLERCAERILCDLCHKLPSPVVRDSETRVPRGSHVDRVDSLAGFFARNLGAFLARFRETDRDGLFSALHAAALATFSGA